MSLAENRVELIGQTPHAHEQAAIQFAIDQLPSRDPYRLYALFELLDASTGRLYEYDLLVVGFSDLYHIEIKSGPGRYEGTQNDWYRTDESGRRRWMEPPFSLANRKSKILKSRLATLFRDPSRCPFIHTLVFLSAEDVSLALKPDGMAGVVTRKNFERAITHHEFPAAPGRSYPQGIPRPVQEELKDSLTKLGLRKREGAAYAGSWRLGKIVEEGAGYQDRVATHRDDERMRRRARIYLVPQQERVERRQQLRRAADREWRLLWELRDHPNILRASDQIADAPLGPVVLFDEMPEAVRLDSFVRDAKPSFESGLALIQQIGRALAYCHKKGIVHGGLSPQSVLVRRPTEETLEARLYDFQLGESDAVSGTHHWTQLASDRWALYQAPELRRDPTARSPQSDLFSLGALAVFVLTGNPPAETVPEVEVRLAKAGHLAPEVGLPEWLVPVIEMATGATLAARGDDIDAWLDILADAHAAEMDRITQPEPTVHVDALRAEKDQQIAFDLTVVRVLGHGATSRVLEVLRTERKESPRRFALKIPLNPDHHARIDAEAAQIKRLDHPNIVRLEERRVIDGRPCLLLSLAGTETLFRRLQQDGSLTLDYASRFGDDLLSALRHLEERACLHRDIKPANIGIGSTDRKALRLTLFDFSLAEAPLSEVQLGTAVYRDPFLFARGRWDAAADRWSAAVTLHEMLTGLRPTFGGRPGDELDPDAKLVLAAERFDAVVRDRLVKFFARSLEREPDRRFDSAEAMRLAWAACFAEPIFSAPATPHPATPHTEPVPFDWAKLALDAPLAALPLDLRAKNALDRAGLTTAGELLALADNRLSAIRGIGSATQRDIADARRAWNLARGAASVVPGTAFEPTYVGPDLLLTSLDLDPSLAQSLESAGLGTLRTLASAPSAHVIALARRHGVEPDSLRALLVREASGDAGGVRPATLDAWVDALLPVGTSKRPSWTRRLYGLERHSNETWERELDVTTLAGRFDVTPAAIYIALGKWSEKFHGHKAFVPLRALVLPVLDEYGGAIGLEALAEAVLARVPAAADATREAGLTHASALVRALAESVRRVADDAPAPPLVITRLESRRLVVVASEAHASAVRALGAVADELAKLPVLASSTEAARLLVAAAENTPLAALGIERLLELAALASRGSSVSARRELYPNGLPAPRALELSAPIASGLAPEEVISRVAARYPRAESLPSRPALDALLAPLGLIWSNEAQRYLRPGEAAVPTRATAFSLVRAPTTVTSHRTLDNDAIVAAGFEQRIIHARDNGLFRVLAVGFHHAPEAAAALGTQLGVAPVELDLHLAAAISKLMKEKGVSPDAVADADRVGPAGPTFRNLTKLAHDAGETLLRSLLARREPLLLTQPGLIARYRMEPFVRGLITAARKDEQPAIFLLVPAVEGTGVPAINGELALPGVAREDVMWVPRPYVENRHHAAA